MTAILGILKKVGDIGAVVLVGDVLVSSPVGEQGSSSMFVPSYGVIDTTKFKTNGYQPSELVQKVSVLTPDLAVAWSGRRIIARALVRNMRETFASREVNFQNVDGWYENEALEIDPTGEVSLIALVRGPGPQLMSRCAYRYEMPRGEIVHVSGTGAGSILARVLNEEELPNSIDDLGFLASWLCGDLIADEVNNLTSIQRLFGGAYEIVVYGNDRFQKLEDMAYMLWFCFVRGPSQIELRPYRVLKYGYSDDLLIARVVIMNDVRTDATIPPLVIPPVDRVLTAEDYKGIVVPPLQSKDYVHVFGWQGRDGKFFTATAISHLTKEMTIEEKDGQIHFQFSDDFIDKIKQVVQRGYSGEAFTIEVKTPS